MSYLSFKDISQYQGNYNMAADPNPIVAIKMGGGDSGLYMDSKASSNYDNAVAHGKAVGGYWFAGATDPIAEANFFLRCMAPLAENDVYILDWEVYHPNPVQWVQQFTQHVHDTIGVWCIVYMNISTANAHDWSPVFKNSGFWCAAPSYSFDAALPVHYPVLAQQGPIVNGVDTDAFFGTLDQFKAYGWHKAKAQAAQTPAAPAVNVTVPSGTQTIPIAPSSASQSATAVTASAVAAETPTQSTQVAQTMDATEAAPVQAPQNKVIVSPQQPTSWINRLILLLIQLFKKG